MTASIFDDVLAETSGKHEGTDATEGTDVTAESTDTNAGEWPKVLNLPVGERPEDAVQVAEFADIVNKELVGARVSELMAEGKSAVEAAMEAMNAQVSQASFYQAVKAQRNPLPHYKVRYEVPVLDENGQDTGETKTDEKVFIPVEVGVEFWKNRPTRGAGVSRTSEEDLGKRLVRAGKKAADLDAAKKRLAKLQANVERMEKQLADYQERLAADGKTLDDATAAYEADQESGEAENAIGDNE